MPTDQPFERRRVQFEGRVQGVGFRATARSIARGHPVTGWVRNEPDESVLLEVEGSPEAVESFLDALRGRMGRLITRESPITLPPTGADAGFEVRY